jgi:hypothetical protein
MSCSRAPRSWAPLLLAAALMIAPGSAPAEAHGDGVAFGNGANGKRFFNGANRRPVEGNGRMIQGNGRAVHGNGRPVGQMTPPAGARVELFVDGKLVYSGQAKAQVSINGNSGMVHRHGVVNGQGRRLVNRNARRPTTGESGRFVNGAGGPFVNGNARHFALPPDGGNGAASGGY